MTVEQQQPTWRPTVDSPSNRSRTSSRRPPPVSSPTRSQPRHSTRTPIAPSLPATRQINEDSHVSPTASEETAIVRYSRTKPWVPWALHWWFWAPLVLTMLAGFISLEILLQHSKAHMGWDTESPYIADEGVLHYVITSSSVAVSMLVGAAWASIDISVRRLQPYMDLARGDAEAHNSILLDYTNTFTFFVWFVAARKNHWLVSLGSILFIITVVFHPLTAALFSVRDVEFPSKISVNNTVVVGLNNDTNFQDLTSFLTAAGYASADVMYDLGDPPFIYQGFTVAPIDIPDGANGTLSASTFAVLSEPTCIQPDGGIVTMINATTPELVMWNNSATFQGCTFGWTVTKVTTNLFGVDIIDSSSSPEPQCANLTSGPPPTRPVVFWYFTYLTSPPMANITLCTPHISLHDVALTLDLASQNLTAVAPLGPLGSVVPLPYDAYASVPPVDVAAPYNGLMFDLDGVEDPFVSAREQAVQLALPAAVFQVAQREAGGVQGAFREMRFAELSQRVYTTYLSLVARTVYFVDWTHPALDVTVTTTRRRLFLSPAATHLLACAMLVLALFGTVLQGFHHRDRKDLMLHLSHEPGTIASAVALGGGTALAEVLDGRQTQRQIKRRVEDRLFRLGRPSEKIFMKGEVGYEEVGLGAKRKRKRGMGEQREGESARGRERGSSRSRA